MSLFTWLGIGRTTWQRGRARSKPRPACRLHVERLEDRTVPSSYSAATVPELIAAIDAANLTPEADTITLAAGAIFTLTEVNNTTNGPTGLPTIAANEDLTILGNGDTIERGTGTPAFRLFDVAAGASLRLENLTLQRGYAFGSGVSAQGGAIFNQGVLTLSGVTVQNSSAQGSELPFEYVAPSAAGGGIYSNGALIVESATIRNNYASGGRGLHAWEHPLGHHGQSGGNGYGGGLYVAGGTASLTNVTLSSNTAQGGDGGNANFGGDSSSGGWGGAGRGGGLYAAAGSTLNLRSTNVTGNFARGGAGGWGGDGGNGGRGVDPTSPGDGGNGGDGLGGGLYAAVGSTVTLRSTSVTDNTAQGGAGGPRGTGGKPAAKDGKAGRSLGGGLYIETSASVCLDDFTIQHVLGNKASTRNANIYGKYTICP